MLNQDRVNGGHTARESVDITVYKSTIQGANDVKFKIRASDSSNRRIVKLNVVIFHGRLLNCLCESCRLKTPKILWLTEI